VYQCDFRNFMAFVTLLHIWLLGCSTTFWNCCWPVELM